MPKIVLTRPKETPELNFIEAALDHLFDFSDRSKFEETEAQIILAYQGKLKPDHALYTLQDCFLHPYKYLHRLDKIGKFTEGKVKETIIHLATKKIFDAVSNDASLPNKVKWEPKAFLDALTKHPTYNKPFKADRLVVYHNLNQEIKQVESARIFTTQLFSENDEDEEGEEIFTFSAQIATTFPDEKSETVELDGPHNRDAFENEEEKKASLQELAPIAELLAIEHASEIALKNLIARNIISEKDAKSITDAGRRVLTHQYYFDSICQGHIAFKDIAQINYTEANSLESILVIELLKEKFCTLAQAKKIPPKILENPFYHRKIRSKQFPLEAFEDLSNSALRNLISSNVMYLLDHNKLTINLAKTLSDHSKLFLEEDIRFEQFKKGEINQDFLISLNYLTQKESKSVEMSPEDKAKHISFVPAMERIRFYCQESWLGLLKLNPRQKLIPPCDKSDVIHFLKWYAMQIIASLRYFKEKASDVVLEQIKPKLIQQFLVAAKAATNCKDPRCKELSHLRKKISNVIRAARIFSIARDKAWKEALTEIFNFGKQSTEKQAGRCCRFFNSSNPFAKQFSTELVNLITEFMQQLEAKPLIANSKKPR